MKYKILVVILIVSIVLNLSLSTTLISKQRSVDRYLQYTYCDISRSLNKTVLYNLRKYLVEADPNLLEDKAYLLNALEASHTEVLKHNIILKKMYPLNNNFTFNLDELGKYLFQLSENLHSEEITSLSEYDKTILNKIINIRFHDELFGFYQKNKYNYNKRPQDFFYDPYFRMNSICKEAIENTTN